MKNRISKKLSRATKQSIQCENGSVLTGKGPYGGGGGVWGYLEFGPGTPPWDRGSIGGILALRAHCALLLDYVPLEEPLGTPLGNALRIR